MTATVSLDPIYTVYAPGTARVRQLTRSDAFHQCDGFTVRDHKWTDGVIGPAVIEPSADLADAWKHARWAVRWGKEVV